MAPCSVSQLISHLPKDTSPLISQFIKKKKTKTKTPNKPALAGTDEIVNLGMYGLGELVGVGALSLTALPVVLAENNDRLLLGITSFTGTVRSGRCSLFIYLGY